jgi:hypothetical protein
MPKRVSDAMTLVSYLQKPIRILVSNKGKFPEIISFEFDVETIAA